jgi:hypothetical protein
METAGMFFPLGCAEAITPGAVRAALKNNQA